MREADGWGKVSACRDLCWASSWASRASPAESSCTPFSSSINSSRSRGSPRFPDSDKDQATSAGNSSEGPRRLRVRSMIRRPRCREARKAASSSATRLVI